MLKYFWQKTSLKNGDSDFSRRIKRITGVKPKNINIYKTAFLHRSCSETTENGSCINNERLEYLGDAVLGSIITEYLYKQYPDEKEGFLTKIRSRIVNGENLRNLAHTIGLNNLIILFL